MYTFNFSVYCRYHLNCLYIFKFPPTGYKKYFFLILVKTVYFKTKRFQSLIMKLFLIIVLTWILLIATEDKHFKIPVILPLVWIACCWILSNFIGFLPSLPSFLSPFLPSFLPPFLPSFLLSFLPYFTTYIIVYVSILILYLFYDCISPSLGLPLFVYVIACKYFTNFFQRFVLYVIF